MLKLYDRVVITEKNVTGIILDVMEQTGGKVYTVESDIKGKVSDAYGGIWPLYECRADEIMAI